MVAEIKKCTLNGGVIAPGSKSMAHRLLICAALSDGESIIENVTFSEDIKATLTCLEKIGACYEINGNCVNVKGCGSVVLKNEDIFDCNESGSTLRFILPLLLLSDVKQILTGRGRLLERPLDVYEDICKKQNLLFEKEDTITVKGRLKAGDYSVKGNISSQFITGLLFALSLLENDSRIIIEPPLESKSYINMTVSAMKSFGVDISWESEYVLFIKGGQRYKPQRISVEGDYSGAAFLDAFNLIEGDVNVTGLNPESLQGDKIYKEYFNSLNKGYCELEVTDCPDLAPILMTVGAIKHGVKLNGTSRLKIKESDRGVVMAAELAKFGAVTTVYENSIVVQKSELNTPEGLLCGHNDHRIVMSLAVIGSLYGAEISEAEAVNKSFPDFFEKFALLGGKVKLI